MAEQVLFQELPDDVLEKIIENFPYPQVIKARLLSKAWRSKFPTLASPGFDRWPHFYCVLQPDGIVAYDVDEDQERKLPLDHRKLQCPLKLSRLTYSVCGPLLVILPPKRKRGVATVLNIFTGRFRKILPPFSGLLRWSQPTLASDGDQEYTLMVTFTAVLLEDPKIDGAYIYSSRSGGWMKAFASASHPSYFNLDIQAIFYGQLLEYLVIQEGACEVIRLNVQDDASKSKVIALDLLEGARIWPSSLDINTYHKCYLVKCSDISFVVAFTRILDERPLRIACLSVFRLGEHSSVEISRQLLSHEQSQVYKCCNNVLVWGSADRIYLSSAEYISSHRGLIFDIF